MKGVALYTFGVFRRPAEDPVNLGFHLRNDRALQAVDMAEGLLGRSGYDSDPGPESWGTQVFPRFYVEAGDGWSPSTLSVWRDVEAALAYSYSGIHAEALAHGRDWFVLPEWPPLVLWWADTRPDWAEAVRRHEHLHDHGPGPQAFTFKAAFDRQGAHYAPDADRVRQLAAVNRQRQRSLWPGA